MKTPPGFGRGFLLRTKAVRDQAGAEDPAQIGAPAGEFAGRIELAIGEERSDRGGKIETESDEPRLPVRTEEQNGRFFGDLKPGKRDGDVSTEILANFIARVKRERQGDG